MSTHQCPKCELRFSWKTELDDHCWHDHPEFRHDYPAEPVVQVAAETPAPEPAAPRARPRFVDGLGRWLAPAHRHD